MQRNLRRGCGTRKVGAVYTVTRPPVERGIDPLDLDYTLICPPWVPWEKSPTEIGLAAQGMLILERRNPDGTGTGIWDLYDWISEGDYPFFPDFFEENRNYGTSRLIPVTSPFKLLTQESRHLFVHANAILADPRPFIIGPELRFKACPSGIDMHMNPQVDVGLYDHCTGLLWEAVGKYDPKNGSRNVTVELPRHRPADEAPSCIYQARTYPVDVTPAWSPGVLMWDTIEMFEIVHDPVDNRHERAKKLIENSGTNIPYMIVPE